MLKEPHTCFLQKSALESELRSFRNISVGLDDAESIDQVLVFEAACPWDLLHHFHQKHSR